MSVLTYNGIQLPMAETTDFIQEAVGDDMGNTDRIYTKYDITIQSIINSAYLVAIDPSLLGVNTANGQTEQSPANIMNNIQQLLLQRRRSFSFMVNGVELIPQPQQGITGTVDARNGPIPQWCKIHELGNTTFLISFRIVAHYWINPDPNATRFPVTNLPGNRVLFNRWSETTDYDEVKLVTRTREGKFVIRSDNADGFTADQCIDQMAVVGVPPGFLRKSSSYKVSPDGLAIMYRVIDVEQFKMPPAPAFAAEGEYGWTSTAKYTWGWGTVRIKLRGSKTTDQADLLRAAVRIATAKIRAPGSIWLATDQPPGGLTFALMENVDIIVNMYENTVEVKLRARTKYDARKNFGVVGNTELNIACFTPESNPNYQPDYKVRGTASRLLQAAAYYDPSIVGTQLGGSIAVPIPIVGGTVTVPVGDQLSTGLQVGQAGKTPEP